MNNIKEWKPKHEFTPKQEQFFEGGVTVCTKPEVIKHGKDGPYPATAREEVNVKIGPDNKGYFAKDAKEENILYKMTLEPDPYGICLKENRQLPAEQKALEQGFSIERAGRLTAEAELKALHDGLKSKGLMDEDGNLK